jgi:hypothetical protein
LSSAVALTAGEYAWEQDPPAARRLADALRPPPGFTRTHEDPGSFGYWLRHLPLKEKSAPVLLYDGRPKSNQDVHASVIDIDTGSRDLQQCADAVIRLRAEYLFSRGRRDEIRFNFTSGDEASFSRWAEGFRPDINGNRVSWVRKAAPDSTYGALRKYLTTVFIYAGSHSLSRELKARRSFRDMAIGDVFIQGGFPGHAVIVVDLAERTESGERVFLLAQSYMPAQDVHLLRNPSDPVLSPWYAKPAGDILRTPEWNFDLEDLKYFP